MKFIFCTKELPAERQDQSKRMSSMSRTKQHTHTHT